ncbi:GNAT family N-acetyltransferase [Dietzia sp. ANT_WB102]|uniref:GNAT family N-acetyltransferase n=1 Tax=Dietzia sp. ANT_WB102 TaxID=2597345 RepID=UPI0011EE6413|nr:GNAT family N-acetyltransferase [Dietzia sp. ANT_WB102]KAA0917304.1 acetyltransferase [Dietzia sp. ANT_WB102]
MTTNAQTYTDLTCTSSTRTSTFHSPAGLVTLESLTLDADTVHTLHAWFDHPGSAYWGLRGTTPTQVEASLSDWSANPHRSLHMVRIDGLRVGLAVFYDPAVVELVGRYPHEPGDLGMHLLVAPARTPVPGTSEAVMGAIEPHAFGRSQR